MPMTEEVTDVVVVGSGAAGLTAALAAAHAGASVTVLEAHERWGGTSGMSGGAIWVPANHLMRDAGIEDSIEAGRDYCAPHSWGRDPALVDAYLQAGTPMVRFLEKHTPLRFTVMDYPDSLPDTPGFRQRGRHLEPLPVDVSEIEDSDGTVWTAPFPMVLTNDELFGGCVHGGTNVPVSLIGRRIAADEVTLGLGLVLGLITGCRDAGVTMVNRCRVTGLLRDDAGRVTGVEAEHDGQRVTLRARGGVVLAAGGYEHDAGLVARTVSGGPLTAPLSAPVSHGDGLRLAASAGAEITHLGESWCMPATPVDGRIWDDPDATARPLMLMAERFLPHSLWVNRHGRRFVDEASHNCAAALTELEPVTHRPRHLPAWALCDAQYREAYVFAGVSPGGRLPGHVRVADSLPELAALIEVDPETLTETVARFNALVDAGADTDFGRGDSPYDRYNGDVRAPHPNLGRLDRPPFFAVQIHRSAIGTKGGARIDARARVLDWNGTAVPGLFAAGGSAAAIFGPGAIANGMHLGTAMTMAWLAGTVAAGAEPALD